MSCSLALCGSSQDRAVRTLSQSDGRGAGVLDPVRGRDGRERGMLNDAPLVFLPLPALLAQFLRRACRDDAAARSGTARIGVVLRGAVRGLRFRVGAGRIAVRVRRRGVRTGAADPAAFFGPLMYLGFAALAVPSGTLRRMAFPHLGAVVGVVVGFQTIPPGLATLDWTIEASYAVYAIALLRLWRQGPDALVHARPGLADGLTRWMPWGAGCWSRCSFSTRPSPSDFWRIGATGRRRQSRSARA